MNSCVTLNTSDTQKDVMAQYNKDRILKTHFKKYGDVKQDGKGRYWCYIPDKSNKNKKKVIRKTYLEDIENIILSLEEYKDLKTIKNSFKDIFYDFIEYSKDVDLVCDNTIRRYETGYARFFTKNTSNIYAKELEKQPINNISIKNLELFIAKCVKGLNKDKKPISKKVFNELWSYLNLVFNYAVRERLIKENYLKFLDKRKFLRQCTVPTYEQQNDVIDNKDIKKLLKVIQDKHLEEDKTIYNLYAEVKIYAVELIIYLGLRPAEVSALKWSNIHFEEENQGHYGDIVVQHSMKERNGKYQLDQTKTGKTRTIPIDEKVKKVLEGIQTLDKTLKRKYDDYLFLEYKDKKIRPISPKSIGQTLERLCDTAKIKRISPTTLRKTFNTRMKLNGISDLVCSSMLGNTVKVNNQHYTYDCMCTKSDKILGLKLANLQL